MAAGINQPLLTSASSATSAAIQCSQPASNSSAVCDSAAKLSLPADPTINSSVCGYHKLLGLHFPLEMFYTRAFHLNSHQKIQISLPLPSWLWFASILQFHPLLCQQKSWLHLVTFLQWCSLWVPNGSVGDRFKYPQKQ